MTQKNRDYLGIAQANVNDGYSDVNLRAAVAYALIDIAQSLRALKDPLEHAETVLS